MNNTDIPGQTEDKILSLSALNRMIGESIRQSFPYEYWVTAEISEMSVNNSGHCYLELIEKKSDADHIIAKSRAIIWSYTFRMLRPYFETTTGRALSPGIKILVLTEITFHEVYGLSLIIKDIEPGYTIGDMALRRQEVIRQLKEEGIFDMNRKLPLPLVPQKIAIISSEKAAGLEDFITHLSEDIHNYFFDWKLFPAVMQGQETEPTIIKALEAINFYPGEFDVVLIIRGGGARADLSAFDRYRLASHIAQFPIPVITGIGHEKDESVTDLVARVSLKTPTAVAQFIINRTEEFELTLFDSVRQITATARNTIEQHTRFLQRSAYSLQHSSMHIITNATLHLKKLLYGFKITVSHLLNFKKREISNFSEAASQTASKCLRKQHSELQTIKLKLKQSTNICLERQKSKIDLTGNSIKLLDPVNTLKRGYSITRYNNKIIRQATEVTAGDILVTRFEKGKKRSKVI